MTIIELMNNSPYLTFFTLVTLLGLLVDLVYKCWQHLLHYLSVRVRAKSCQHCNPPSSPSSARIPDANQPMEGNTPGPLEDLPAGKL